MSTGDDGRDLARAQSLVELGRHGEARDVLVRINATDPTPASWCLLSQCSSALGDAWQGLQAANQALRLDPDDEWAFRLRAQAMTTLVRHPEAVAAAREAVRLAPLNWQGHAGLATAAMGNGDTATAVAAGDESARLGPHVAEAHFVRGLALMAADRAHEGAAAYGRALAIDPEHAAARNNLGVLALRRGQVADAANHFLAVSRGDPRSQLGSNNLVAVGWTVWLEAMGVLLVAFACVTLVGLVTRVDGVPGPSGPRVLLALGIPVIGAAAVAVRARRLPLRTIIRAVRRSRIRWALLAIPVTWGLIVVLALADPISPSVASLIARGMFFASISGWIIRRKAARQ